MFEIVAYFDAIFCPRSPNGEESFDKLLSPDPDLDHLREGLSHRGYYLLCKKIKSIGALVF